MATLILIVEDDESTRDIYRDALEARGYTVLTAKHGAEGVHMARKYLPRLILLDIRMPVMDGWHALQYLRTDHQTARMSIWGVSAHFDEETAPVPGFDRLLSKPLDPADLVLEVESHIGPAIPPPAA
ncbi:MAG: response regulator [Gemmatimonadota bacterium]